MLLGEHEHTIDDKNRLTLPARFRPAFVEGIVVTRGMDSSSFHSIFGLIAGALFVRDVIARSGATLGSSSNTFAAMSRGLLPVFSVESSTPARRVTATRCGNSD